MKYQKLKGTKDYFGDDYERLNLTTTKLITLATSFAYERIRFPLLEEEAVFSRAIGLGTDIVNKEMYKIIDKKNRTLVLRPEGTASSIRLVVENKLLTKNLTNKYFYIENMYRYERPQRGRYREFIQFGVEQLGDNDA